VAYFLWQRRRKADQQLDDEHPIRTRWTEQAGQLYKLAVQVAADVPDDAQALATMRAAGGKPQDYKRAAALIRRDRYNYEHRNYRRAARLLAAVADGGPPAAISAEEEALFRGVESLEALPAEDAFAVLAAEVPALLELERQVITSRSAPGWEDRDARERRREIRDNLARLVGPEAPAGSLFTRSEAALRYARAHLLGKAGLLREDPVASAAEQAETLALLAVGYGVAPGLTSVGKAVSKRAAGRPTFREDYMAAAVLEVLVRERGIAARLRRGEDPADHFRMRMIDIVALNLPRPADFVDKVVEEVRSTLLRPPGDIGEE
jgi:hypothetical protein